MYEQAYQTGITFEQFLSAAAANREMWQAMATRARVSPEAVRRARETPGRWRLLVIAEDWCGDAVNILPVVARLAEDLESLDLRITGQESWPALMDRHLTNGSRSIPVVILLDDAGACHGWWGPRPSQLQEWFESEGRPLPKEDRYRELRRWYARDRGAAVAAEIVDLIRCGVSPDREECGGTRPCRELQAA